VSTCKDPFREANLRCRAHGMDLSAHAHLLRHTFAVVTLEQLQRGHISTLAQLNSEQRGHYTRIDLRRPAGLGPATVGPPIGSHDADYLYAWPSSRWLPASPARGTTSPPAWRW
jgi:hypothetical protein